MLSIDSQKQSNSGGHRLLVLESKYQPLALSKDLQLLDQWADKNTGMFSGVYKKRDRRTVKVF